MAIVSLFPIGTKVRYTDVNGDGYKDLSDPFGVVVGHGYSGVMVDVKFLEEGTFLCYPEELEAVPSVGNNGQYSMEL